jgi:hypothetical protein
VILCNRRKTTVCPDFGNVFIYCNTLFNGPKCYFGKGIGHIKQKDIIIIDYTVRREKNVNEEKKYN